MVVPGRAVDHRHEPAWSLVMTLTNRMACLSMVLALFPATVVGEARAHTGPYVDLVDFPYNEANWDRFYDLQDHLTREFHDLCGARYCQGAYANHILLQFRCSVQVASGSVGACTMVIGAGNLEVDATSGKVVPDSRTWACAAPLVPGTSVEALHAALGRRDALILPLPGANQSMHDALFDCLN
jgi:hypothetical protein